MIMLYLSPEHGSGRDFHVVTQLEICNEGKCLRHAHVTVRLKHYIRQWFSRVQVPNYQLCYDVQTWLLYVHKLRYTSDYKKEKRHQLSNRDFRSFIRLYELLA
jgi:hypothetical protein